MLVSQCPMPVPFCQLCSVNKIVASSWVLRDIEEFYFQMMRHNKPVCSLVTDSDTVALE